MSALLWPVMAAALALGCSSGAPEESDPRLQGPHVLHEAEPCGMAFDPDLELREATELAAERWSEATGCDVRVEAGGIRVHAWPRLFVDYLPDGRAALSELPGPDSKNLCGLFTRRGDLTILDIALQSSCGPEYAVAHEMGHALNGHGHSRSGLMAAGDNPDASPVIDEASLALVCAGLPCTVFSPER